MTNKEKVQAVLQGGGKYTEGELATITGIAVTEVALIVRQIPGIAYKDYLYYIPQHNGHWITAIGSVLITFLVIVCAGL